MTKNWQCQFFVNVRKWLYDFEPDDHATIGTLLKDINSFIPIPSHNLPLFSQIATDEVLLDSSPHYMGTKGLQKAVIRFLCMAIISGAKELLLYSDEEMDWLVEDADFHLKWITLMTASVNHGIHIKIIHNIERDIPEMFEAIKSWLPLYMSGMIEPYYCTEKHENRFLHTLFLCPEVACISAFHGTEAPSERFYHYYTDKKFLNCRYQTFDSLLNASKLLVRMKSGKPAVKKGDSLPMEEFNNICIMIHKTSVVVSRTTAPYISFVFLHPLMYEAFKAFVKQQSDTEPI